MHSPSFHVSPIVTLICIKNTRKNVCLCKGTASLISSSAGVHSGHCWILGWTLAHSVFCTFSIHSLQTQRLGLAWKGGKNGLLERVRLANNSCLSVQTSRGSVDDSKKPTDTREHLIKRMFLYYYYCAHKTGVWLFMYQFPQRRLWQMNHKLRNHCQWEKQCFLLENPREAGICCCCSLEVMKESEGWCGNYMDLPSKQSECGFCCRNTCLSVYFSIDLDVEQKCF